MSRPTNKERLDEVRGLIQGQVDGQYVLTSKDDTVRGICARIDSIKGASFRTKDAAANLRCALYALLDAVAEDLAKPRGLTPKRKARHG